MKTAETMARKWIHIFFHTAKRDVDLGITVSFNLTQQSVQQTIDREKKSGGNDN